MEERETYTSEGGERELRGSKVKLVETGVRCGGAKWYSWRDSKYLEREAQRFCEIRGYSTMHA